VQGVQSLELQLVVLLLERQLVLLPAAACGCECHALGCRLFTKVTESLRHPVGKVAAPAAAQQSATVSTHLLHTLKR
jgi:hypothetical protein